jgi:hypothetical protein
MIILFISEAYEYFGLPVAGNDRKALAVIHFGDVKDVCY